jgi:hypothetical protein
VISRKSFHRLARVARLGTAVAALVAGLTLAGPAGLAAAQEVKAIRENGMLVTPAAIGKSYYSLLSARNRDTMQFANGTLVEVWKVQGNRGQCVEVSMHSDAFDSMLDMFAVHPVTGEMELIGRNDDGGEGLDARLRGQLPATGTYYVVASAADGEDPDGKYDLAFKSC